MLNSDLEIEMVQIKTGLCLERQGKRRLLRANGVATDSNAVLTTLSSGDLPAETVANHILMVYGNTYYSGVMLVNFALNGTVGVYWYDPGNSGANAIGNTQVIYGEAEWYVP